MTLKKIENRLTTVAQYGKATGTEPVEEAPYDGGHLTSFYARYGGNVKDMRSLLRQSRVGSIFDLESGTSLIIPNHLIIPNQTN